ncbi:unnamed protein product [Lymnaea stagnalis]|uniref:Transmembrane protein n=1 Tax=Lymnaea stagnalis TaxID=6523 RepID=A0AAV2H860_LYMST
MPHRKQERFLELQGFSAEKNDTFPYSGMRIMGAIQINTGIIVFVLGMVDLVMTLTSYDADVQKYGEPYERIVSLTLASSPLWCGIWFSITGGLGACITRHKAQSLQFLKIAFLILNIICCALFGPVCTFINGYLSYSRHTLDNCKLQWLVTLIICFLGVLEIVMATASAAVTCCCSPLPASQVHILVNPRSIKNGRLVLDRESTDVSTISSTSDKEPPRKVKVLNTHRRYDDEPQRRRRATVKRRPAAQDVERAPTPVELFQVSDARDTKAAVTSNSNHKEVHKSPPFIKTVLRSQQVSPAKSDASLRDPLDVVTPMPTPRAEVSEPIYDSFGDSSGYPKLKKWALPHW